MIEKSLAATSAHRDLPENFLHCSFLSVYILPSSHNGYLSVKIATLY